MDPSTPAPYIQAISPLQSFAGFVFAPGIFESEEVRDEYLSSLDSDTRAYVISHTDEFRTRADISDCVNRLHGES